MRDRALRFRLAVLVALLTCGLFVATDANAPTRPGDPGSFTVHEWGTFTSIAGADGGAVEWTPLNSQDDLPCFVNRLRFGPKWSLRGTVRMETPVLYFYAPTEVAVDIGVRFNQGVITEWYPDATVTPTALPATAADAGRRLVDRIGTAAWTKVRVRPGAAPDFPREDSPSHYYPARETDAAPVQVGKALERFLFYRGVGAFPPPVNALVQPDGRIVVSARTDAPLGDIIAFDNRGGTVTYLALRENGQQTTIDPALLTQHPAGSLNDHFERVLIANGLYPKEARAMIATWRDTWFEEGARLFYIAPQPSVEAVLPLQFAPRPADVARVFVGRIELMTPRTIADVKSGLLANHEATLAKYGRFMEPFADRMMAESSPIERVAMGRALQIIYRNWRPPLSGCR
jgi:hypothetical protein